MEFISDRVSYQQWEGGLSVVISNRLPRSKVFLLIAWLLAWTACGYVFIHEFSRGVEKDMFVPMIILLAFWIYFEIRVLLVVLWRLKGFELWRVQEGELTIKDSLFRLGKANRYFIANIKRFGLLNMDETSWKWQMSDSFWTRGAERLGFEYHEKKVAFGRGLTKEEAGKLVHLVAAALKRERKSGA
ncbi:MAG: hypothetical protein WBB32_03590 [Flavobacteriales bacterium]|nr:hypothetical protein [Flavobacteriales bacterium]